MDSERVYVPLVSKQVVALNRESGSVLWTCDAEAIEPPVVDGGAVYVIGPDAVRALDAATGEQRWMVALGHPPATRLAVAAGLLVVLLDTRELVALRTATGETAWRVSVEGEEGDYSLATDDDTVYLAMPGGRVAARALVDGHTLWDQRLGGSLSRPVVARERVFVGSSDNFLYALKPASGVVEWKMGSGGDVIGAGVNDEVVFFASLDNGVRALNRANGNQRWRKTSPTRPIVPPIVTDGEVVVAGLSPTLSTFDARTGARGDTYAFPDKVEIEGAPLVDRALRPFQIGAVIITRDGRVVALRPNSTTYREAATVPMLSLPGRSLTREQLP